MLSAGRSHPPRIDWMILLHDAKRDLGLVSRALDDDGALGRDEVARQRKHDPLGSRGLPRLWYRFENDGILPGARAAELVADAETREISAQKDPHVVEC